MRKPTTPSAGPIALAILTPWLAACAPPPTPVATAPTTPDYSAAFLDCVAGAVERREWRPCVGEALADWWVLAGNEGGK